MAYTDERLPRSDLARAASTRDLLAGNRERPRLRGCGVSTSEWSGEGWQIAVGDAAVTVSQASGPLTIPGAEASRLDVRRRWFRWSLLCDGRRLVRLRGIRNSEASALGRALRRLALAPAIAEAATWRAALEQRLARARTEQRWIPTEAVDALLAIRPQPGLLARARADGLEPSLTAAELEALRSLDTNMESLVSGTNREILAAELSSRRRFFDTIETCPLTDEQTKAVVCFDNRVQVLAAAGSGKTSVMVARAAYAVSRGFVAPDRILLLAFNKAAAMELQERIVARFAAAGLDSTGVRASTFHAFGLDVIGRATGEKPRLARWLDQGEDVQMVLRIVNDLRATSVSFRYRWDLYRMLFANAPTILDENEPDGYDRATSQTGYRTFAGEVVKSHGERLIANFLYLNGINYVYERPYEVSGRRIASSTRSQYRPDFYYPDIDVWHEHWALDRDGKPPAAFPGYAQDMAWKRRIHAQYGTTLVESTWAEVMFGDGLAKLRDRLTRLGLTFTWDPDRPARDRWAKPVTDEDLARLVRTFMAHVKSNSWTTETLERRLTAELAHLAGFRTRLFLDLYWQIHAGVGAAACRRGHRRLRGHARPGRRAPRGGGGELPVRPHPGRRVPGHEPGSCPGRPRLGEPARPLPARGRRRLAGDQPLRRLRHLGDDRLRGVVRAGAPAGADDHFPLHPDDLRRCPSLREQEPGSVQEGDAVDPPRPRSARHGRPDRQPRRRTSSLPERSIREGKRRHHPDSSLREGERRRPRALRIRARCPTQPPAVKPSGHLPHCARVQGAGVRLRRHPRLDHRDLRVPEHHRRRPRPRSGHARTRVVPPCRGTAPLLRGAYPCAPCGDDHHLAHADVPVRRRASPRPRRFRDWQQRRARRGLSRVREGDARPTEKRIRPVPRVLHLPRLQVHASVAVA